MAWGYTYQTEGLHSGLRVLIATGGASSSKSLVYHFAAMMHTFTRVAALLNLVQTWHFRSARKLCSKPSKSVVFTEAHMKARNLLLIPNFPTNLQFVSYLECYIDT